MNEQKAQELLSRGVELHEPASIEIAPEVNLEAIAPGAVLHAGTRIRGAKTSIGPKSEIGAEAPATLVDCRLGRGVKLKGGYFEDAVFLDGAAMGSCAHVRAGTLLEEKSGFAHACGLKQTVALPFAEGGSVINFCDALLAGGTGSKDHTEIGSGFIHFNFTPLADKATASMFGDVCRGVFLRSRKIFLGGQSGVAGPVRVAYGTILAAGTMLRSDVLEPGHLVSPPPAPAGDRAYTPGCRHVARKVAACLAYIGEIHALDTWYAFARAPLFKADRWEKACHDGAREQLATILKERVKRLDEFAKKLGPVPARDEQSAAEKDAFLAAWPGKKAALEKMVAAPSEAGAEDREAFLAVWTALSGTYLERIAALDDAAIARGTRWLSAVAATAK